MKYLLKTPYPCLVKTLKDYVELEENDSLELEDESVIFIYPQNNNIIPFYINLNTLKENGKFSVVDQNGHKILLLEPEKKANFLKKERLSFGTKSCEIEIAQEHISFETNEKKVIVKHKHPFKEVKIFKIKNFACAQFNHDLYAFCLDNEKLSHFSGDEIIFDNTHLKISKNFNDSLNRQKNAEYDFADNITILNENYSHSPNFIVDLVPFRLMESIKAKDYNYAYDCLSNNLKEKINKEQIKNFFGDFNIFLPLSTTEFITMSNNEKNYVKIDLSQNKVTEISIDKL